MSDVGLCEANSSQNINNRNQYLVVVMNADPCISFIISLLPRFYCESLSHCVLDAVQLIWICLLCCVVFLIWLNNYGLWLSIRMHVHALWRISVALLRRNVTENVFDSWQCTRRCDTLFTRPFHSISLIPISIVRRSLQVSKISGTTSSWLLLILPWCDTCNHGLCLGVFYSIWIHIS